MNIIISGDFCDRYRVSEHILAGKYDKLFGAIKPIINSVDYSIVNLEFPIVTSNDNPIHKCGPNLKGNIKAIDAIKYTGFTCTTLANNHILDQGESYCLKTKELLEENDINTVGVGTDENDASKTLYINIQSKRVAIINCCEHEFSIATPTTAGANALNPIKQYYSIKEAKQEADYVVVIVHGGHEFFNLPSIRMKETYRFFIDAGADAVINHHQHCFSGYEIYNNKPIFYGIGNLLFDEPTKRHSDWNEGYMVELIFEDNNCTFKTHPYKQCNDDVGIMLLSSKEKEIFEEKIKSINNIIRDDKLLSEKINSNYDSNSLWEILNLEPYKGRILYKLYTLNLLPKWICGDKIYSIFNHIACESHRDRLLHSLKKRF